MKILIDTNIILDLLQVREPFSENALKIVNSCIKKENEGFISAHSLSDIFFILRKDKTVEERKFLIGSISSFNENTVELLFRHVEQSETSLKILLIF